MLPPSLDNVVAYCVQVAVLTVAGGLLVALVRLRLPEARLVYWRVLLLACVVLPLLQPWVELRAVPASTVTLEETSLAAATDASGDGWPMPIDSSRILFAVWLVGVVTCLVRLVLGLFGLRTLRHRGSVAQLAPEFREIGGLLHVSSDVRWVADLPQPVTFWRPTSRRVVAREAPHHGDRRATSGDDARAAPREAPRLGLGRG